jgi:hypothetical protein
MFVALEDRTVLVAGELHRHPFRDGGPHEVAHGRSPRVMQNPAGAVGRDSGFRHALLKPPSVKPFPVFWPLA